MLVVTRKVNQKLSISGGITITVVRVGVGNVRIGIDAPADVVVMRTEVLDRDPCLLGVSSVTACSEVAA